MLSETWLSKSIPDSVNNIGIKYEIFWLDKEGIGGGVQVYTSLSTRVERITYLEETGKKFSGWF